MLVLWPLWMTMSQALPVAEEMACFGCPVSVIFVAHSLGVQTQP